MKKYIMGLLFLLTLTIILRICFNEPIPEVIKNNEVKVTILSKTDNNITVQDVNHVIYTIPIQDVDLMIGDTIAIEYTGVLDKSNIDQDVVVIDYNVIEPDPLNISEIWQDNGIFSKYYNLAYNKLQELTLDEKIGQLFLVRYKDSAIEDLKKYNFGGFVFYGKDFKNKTKQEVINMIKDVQDNSKIPLLTAVDEEGGIVIRVSSNPKLVSTPYKSSSTLYQEGGLNLIREDTIDKSRVLKDLGLNLNLAPVVDVSTDPSDYMYERSLKENTAIVSDYAKTVIEASKGTGVSYTLKHFPGYADNLDTHIGSSVDARTLEEIKTNDLPPFEAGIKAGAEAILFSHNIVNSIDMNNPVSLSISAHNLLRHDLGFTGIIMTDDLDMGALNSINDLAPTALLAGNDLLISTNYEEDIDNVKKAINNNEISEELIDKLTFRVLSWKYYKGLMINVK